MRGSRGTSLVEVVIAILLVAMMTGPIMSTVLTTAVSQHRVERRVTAAASARALSESLKGYVTADRRLAPGPGVGRDGWTLPGDAEGIYALAPGVHRLDAAVWAPGLPGATVAYAVTVRDTPSGPEPDVDMAFQWEDDH
jgi:hypothetical protein